MATETRLSIVVDAQDKASATLKGIQGNLKDMQPAFKAMAVAGTAAFGVITAVGVSALKEFADSQKKATIANQALSNAMDEMSDKTFGKLVKEAGGSLKAFDFLKTKMQDAGKAALQLGFDDDEARLSFAKLYQVSQDVAQAQEDLKLAMDLSAFSGRSLEESAAAVTKVHAGATRVLKEFGIEVANDATNEEALALLHQRTAGTAAQLSLTLEGRTRIMTEQFNNLKESIGGALAPALTQLLTIVTPVIEKMVDWANNNPDLLAKIILVTAGIAGLIAVVGTIGLALPVVVTGVSALSTALLFLAANPLVAVPVALAFLAMKFIELIKVTGGFGNAMVAMGDTIIDWWKKSGEWIYDKIQKLINLMTKLADKASSIAGGAISGALKAVGVKDAIIAPGGKIITTDPADYIIATKDPSSLAGGGGAINININGAIFSEDAARTLGDMLFRQLNAQIRI